MADDLTSAHAAVASDVAHSPVLPEEPSSITDAELPALVEQLRGVFAEIAKAAVAEAQASMPMPRVIQGTVAQVDVANNAVVVQTDDALEGGEVSAQVVAERPNPNERVTILSIPGGAAFVIGIPGGTGVPPGALIGYVGPITAAVASSTDTAPPRGYAMAYGQVLKQNAVPWYFARVGTTHNTGGEAADEVRLPDARGRYPMGLDDMGGSDAGRIGSIANAVGASGGAETHTLATGNLPSHSHTLASHTHSFTPAGSVSGISGSVSGTTGDANVYPVIDSFSGFGDAAPNSAQGNAVYGPATNTHSHSFSGSFSGVSGTFTGTPGTTGGPSTGDTGSAGSGTSVNHLPPTLAVFWLVKL